MHVRHEAFVRVEGRVRADDDGVLLRQDPDNIDLPVRGHAQAAALADGIVDDAAVRADDIAVQVQKRAGLGFLAGARGDDLRVVAVGDEADVLAVVLAGVAEAGFGGDLPRVGLAEGAEGEFDAGELLLRQVVEDVALVLGLVEGLFEDVLLPCPLDAGVVAGGDIAAAQDIGALNSMVPIWNKNKKDVTDEEYNNFYKEKFFDFEDPLAVIHANVEGAVTYKALLYIPAKAPYDFYTKDFKKGLQLYSSGVMIMENCADLLPDCFRFVRGVVDSQDLSLNISREMLQHDRQLKFIAGNLEKKIKAELQKLLDNDREKYEKFFAAFGPQIKYGVLADYGAKKEALQDLLLYWSSKEGKLISLKEYAAAMPEDQKYIYYANGESRERLGQLPQMEKLQQKGYDVLFMTDEVDGFVPQTLGKYQEKELKSITAGDLGLETEEEKKAAEEKSEKSKQTLDFVKKTLGDKVRDVRLSDNLGSHPVSVVPAEGMTFEMEKYFKRVDPNSGMKADRILEFNADHPIFAKLQIAVAQDEKKAEDLVKILYTQALLMADLPVENAGEYTDLVCSLIG